jgi:hypothetical protein
MKGTARMVAGTLAALSLAMLAPGPASARGHLQLALSSKTVTAGGSLTLTLSHTHRRRCVLSLRRDRFGAPVRSRRKIAKGRTVLAIPASAKLGGRVVTVRCGSRTVTKRFAIVANQKRLLAPPSTGPTPDEQGFVPGLFGSQEPELTGGQLGGGDYPNSRIADIGLSKLGQNLYTPGWLDHGQCKQAVNDWVAQASGGTQRMGGDYYANYARNGGQQVARDDAAKGDVIQLDNPSDISNYYRGMHTAVVVSHAGGSNSFDVVDSNFHLDDVVNRHAWDPYAAGQKYGLRVTIWRMGTADAPATPPTPTPTPTPAPTPPATRAETTGGPTNTWTNYTNAGGSQGPTIPSNATVQIACKLQGFRVADGNTWWYRIASAPWNGAYYASADAFYNNGQTSGSLHGTPFVDPAVPDC